VAIERHATLDEEWEVCTRTIKPDELGLLRRDLFEERFDEGGFRRRRIGGFWQ
jgi:hypothetical protein